MQRAASARNRKEGVPTYPLKLVSCYFLLTRKRINIKTKRYPEKIQCGGVNKSAESVKEEINTATKEIGRYHINWGWKDQELDHIIVAERLPNSEFFLFDPQTGKEFNWEEKVKRIDIAQRLFVLKVDGLLLNTPVVKTVVKVKG